MRQAGSVERWGPLVVSILTLLALVGYAWNRDQRTAALEAREALRTANEASEHLDRQMLMTYIQQLRLDLARAGIKPPPMPETKPAASGEK